MQRIQERPRGNEYRTTTVCVDSFEESILSGRFYNPSCPEGERFSSLIQFLVKMEDLLDDMRLPQSFTAARSFSAPPASVSAPAADAGERTGRLATFEVRILFRQNASWQGMVAWKEGSMEQGFRSVLELILLMDGALREASHSVGGSAQ